MKKTTNVPIDRQCLFPECANNRGDSFMCVKHWKAVPYGVKLEIHEAYVDVDAWCNLGKNKVPVSFRKAIEKAIAEINESEKK